MKEKFLKIQFLVYAVLTFAVASVLESYLSGLRTFDIDTDRLERVLHAKEARLDSIVECIRGEVNSGEHVVQQSGIWLLERNFDYLADEGFSVCVYENDTLKYWTDNLAPVGLVYMPSVLNNRMANIKNVWYEIRTTVEGNRKYVGLIFLRHKYHFNNKYLLNDFAPEFRLGATVQLSMIPLSYGFDIKDMEGKYIFSLVPTNSYDLDGQKFHIVGVLFLISLMLLLVYVNGVIGALAQQPGNSLKIASVILGVVVARIVLLLLKFPSNIYSLDFFDPEYFSGGILFDTIGDFIANAVVMLAVIHYLFVLADYSGLRDKVAALSSTAKNSVWAGLASIYLMGFGYLYHLVWLMVSEDKISFHLNNFSSLDIFSWSGIVVIVIVTAIIMYASVRITEYFDYSLISNTRRAVIIYVAGALGLSLLVMAVGGLLPGLALLYALLMLGTALLMHYQKVESVLYRYIFMLMISALFASTVISVTTQDNANRQCRDLSVRPSEAHDAIADLLLSEMQDRLQDDDMVPDFLRRISDSQQLSTRLRNYLQQWFFNGYWSKYNLTVKVLECNEGEFFSQLDDDFVHTIQDMGSKVDNTTFYFVAKPDGTIGYYSPIKYTCNGKTMYVCVMLDSKPVPQELGYPDLLIDDNVKASAIQDYDNARYLNGRKLYQTGSFSYDISDRMFLEPFGWDADRDTIHVMTEAGYTHTIYHKGDTTMVVSRQEFTFMDFVIQFAYLFLIFIVVMLVYLGIMLVATHNTSWRQSLKTRLIMSLVFILMLSFVFICAGTIFMNIHKFRAQNTTSISEKVKSVYMDLSQHCADSSCFGTVWDTTNISSMDEYLTRIAHVFFTDINLYAPGGQLVATSRPEVFRQGLVSNRMNSTALRSFVLDSKSFFIQDEKIGTMSYASAYIPFYPHGDNLAGYINLPYFANPEVLERETSTLIVSITNLYLILMIISIVVAVIVSERIVHPIKMIQSKMETIELGKNYEKIDYPTNDELGQLVAEYNNMVEKLDESAKLLAQGERESAWRTMARQVAHEIKNPLTPMKLSIQFLTRTWQQDDTNFGEKLSKVSNTLIQQIDTLSSIATSFSNFAKMPHPVAVPLNVVEMLANVVALYQNTENIDVTSDLGDHKEIICMLDKEQIIRVFVNIIKNATQAIPDGVRGKIHVTLNKESADKVVVRIADNGTGIPDEIREKLFTPNFTTKSAGSGLGLAMVKTMVENVKGSITFESEVGKGTTFIITLPIKED